MRIIKISADSLVFEVTRKCNMTCRHCLRGRAQNKNISNVIVNRTLKDISYVSTLTFTGGEPLLNQKAIKYIFNRLHKKNIEFNSFWLATNGSIYNQSFVNLLIREYNYCMDVSGGEFYGGIAISHNDGFHQSVSEINLMKYKALKFYDHSKESKYERGSIINDGYAKSNYIGSREVKVQTYLNHEIDNDEIRLEDTLYINVLGDVLLGCDYSYSKQKRAKIGNVLEKPLLKIIEEHIKTQR